MIAKLLAPIFMTGAAAAAVALAPVATASNQALRRWPHPTGLGHELTNGAPPQSRRTERPRGRRPSRPCRAPTPTRM